MEELNIHTRMQDEVAIDLGEEQTQDFVMKQIKERISLQRMMNFDDSDPVYYSNQQNQLNATKDKLDTLAANNTLFRLSPSIETAKAFKARDGLAHIMIRYSIQNDFEKAFIEKEAKIFYMRLQNLIISSRVDQSETSFVEKVADLAGTVRITPEEFNALRGELAAALKQDPNKLRLNAFIKIKFSTVPKVVSSRRCIIKKGWVYCSINEYKIQIVDQFKKKLIKNIAFDKNVIQYMKSRNLDFSDIHKEIFKSIQKEMVGLSMEINQFDSKELKNMNSIDLKTLQDLMNTGKVPPCIKQMQDSMRTQNHLKFMGRFMMTGFLKSVGVGEQVAESFLRQEFSHSNINSADFDKHYKQNIRHLQGLEGSRKDYNVPHSCNYFATNLPTGPEQTHGCPFKHLDSTKLRGFLKKNYIRQDQYNYILNDVISIRNNYTQACSTVFNYSHFAIKKDENGRELPQTFNKSENSTQPVRFSIKAMQLSDMKIDQNKYYYAYRTNLEANPNNTTINNESLDDTIKINNTTIND